MIRSTLRVVLASLICSSLLPAQRGTARRMAPEEGGMLQVEALTLPSAEPGKARVDVLYRIPRRFFVFVRPEPVTQAAAFVARAEIAVELFDPGDRSAARDYSVRELSASAPQEGADGSEVGQSSFIVPPGAYTLFMEVRDRESNRVAQSRTPLTVPAPRDTTFASGILLCAPAAGTDVVPLNHGGDIPLGARADAWFLVASADTFSSCSAAYRLTRSPSEELDSAAAGADSIAALASYDARSLQRVHDDTIVRFGETGDPLPGMHRVRLPLSLDTLVPARYTLKVTVRAAGRVWNGSTTFAIRWFDMPLSLRYIESAVEPMEYLLTPDEFKNLRRSDSKTKRAFFDAYWKARDLTPGTAYNEVLAEFYRRVDYARRTFNTLKAENGARTERGKAYILYGPPEKIDRMLLASSAPQETWYYPALGRKLTFVDRGKTGDYTLIATEQL